MTGTSKRGRSPAFRRRAAAWALLVLAAGFGAGAPARAEDPKYLTYGVGAFDINGDDTSALVSLEYGHDKKWLGLFKPIAGLFVNHEAGIYGYAGVAVDLYFGRRIVLTPSFAPGLYFEGGSKDLGHVVEFRSAIRAAWRLDDRSRIGVDFSHISNAGLDDRNPGANQLMLFYSRPLSRGSE